MAKRIYTETVKKWLIRSGITAGTLISGIFLYLIFLNAITITGYSGDQICAGTLEDPCYAYINLTAKEDIFIYPVGYDPWGRDTFIEFDPAVKSWKLQRSWGSYWKNIPLNETCTGKWCGAPDNKGVAYSYVLREGRDYQFRIVGYKKDPKETIKWAVNYDDREYLDPTWYGVGNYEIEGDSVVVRDPKFFINVTPHTGDHPLFNLTTYNYTGDIDLVFLFDTEFVKPTKAELFDPRWVVHNRSYTCEDIPKWNSTHFWCYKNESNFDNSSYSLELLYEHDYDSGNAQTKTAYWDESIFEKYRDVSGVFTKREIDFNGFNIAYVRKNIPIVANESLALRLTLGHLDFNGGHKYGIAGKPSHLTIEEAISSGNFFYIDPWTDSLREGLTMVHTLNDSDVSGSISVDVLQKQNGTIGGNAWTGITGKLAEGYRFSGGAIDFTNSSDLYDSAHFSACTWINSTNGASYNFFQKTPTEDEVSSFDWRGRFGVDKFYFYIETLTTYVGSVWVDRDLGQWNHVCFVFNGSAPTDTTRAKIYVNGTDGTVAGAGTIAASMTFDATYETYAGVYLTGYLDQILMFNRSLEASEVASIYNNYDGMAYEGPEAPTDAYPQYSANSTNSTLAGQAIEHRLNWTDDVGLSGYIFSFDNATGTLANDSWVKFMSQNVSYNATSYYCDLTGEYYGGNCADTSDGDWTSYVSVCSAGNSFNVFKNYTLLDNVSAAINIKVDGSTPKNISFWNETSSAWDLIQHVATGALNTTLAVPSYYILDQQILRTNTDLTGTAPAWCGIFYESNITFWGNEVNHSWSNVTKVINAIAGKTIRWKIYANDSANQLNASELYTYVSTSADTCTFPGATNNWEVDMEDNCNHTVAGTLSTGNLSWIGSSGYFNCSAQLNLTNRDAPPSGTIFYWSDGCEVIRLIILILFMPATIFIKKRSLKRTC